MLHVHSNGYAITERFFTSAHGGWLRDKFTGIDDRYYIGPAVGYKFLIGPKHFLSAEAGVDYVKEDYVDNTDDDYMRGRVSGEYTFALTEKTRFSQSLEYLHAFDNSDNYNIANLAGGFSDLGLDSSMLGKFIPIVLSFVQEKGGSGVKDLLGGVLK